MHIQIRGVEKCNTYVPTYVPTRLVPTYMGNSLSLVLCSNKHGIRMQYKQISTCDDRKKRCLLSQIDTNLPNFCINTHSNTWLGPMHPL